MAFLQRRTVQLCAGLVLLVLITVAVLIVLLPKPEARHSPLAYDDSFDFATGTFAGYTEYALGRLQMARGGAADATQLANLAPFRLEPGAECARAADGRFTHGIVLTHGLLASPYALRDIGSYFQSRCFLVLGVLLPGHGTRPGDLPAVSWQQWAEVQAFATRALAAEAQTVVLAGHGAGATLALLEAAGNSAVSSLILFAPALGTGTVTWFDTLVAALGTLVPPLRWAELLPDDDVYGYESRPWRATAETAALARATHRALASQPLAIPVLTIASIEDNTVSTPAILDFMAEQRHPASHMLLYSAGQQPRRPNTTNISTALPDYGVLSLAHPGLMIAPYNPYYGLDGSYRNCSHYYVANRPAYDLCKAGDAEFRGEVTPENLAEGIIERLLSNPFYPDLEDSLDTFIFPGAPSRRPERI